MAAERRVKLDLRLGLIAASLSCVFGLCFVLANHTPSSVWSILCLPGMVGLMVAAAVTIVATGFRVHNGGNPYVIALISVFINTSLYWFVFTAGAALMRRIEERRHG